MKTLSTWLCATVIFCALLTSCSSDATADDDALFLIEDVQGNDEASTPPDNSKNGG